MSYRYEALKKRQRINYDDSGIFPHLTRKGVRSYDYYGTVGEDPPVDPPDDPPVPPDPLTLDWLEGPDGAIWEPEAYTSFPDCPTTPLDYDHLDSMNNTFVDEVNKYRVLNSVPELTYDRNLAIAQVWAVDDNAKNSNDPVNNVTYIPVRELIPAITDPTGDQHERAKCAHFGIEINSSIVGPYELRAPSEFGNTVSNEAEFFNYIRQAYLDGTPGWAHDLFIDLTTDTNLVYAGLAVWAGYVSIHASTADNVTLGTGRMDYDDPDKLIFEQYEEFVGGFPMPNHMVCAKDPLTEPCPTNTYTYPPACVDHASMKAGTLDFWNAMNAWRVAGGRQPLIWSDNLSTMAYLIASHCADYNWLGHSNPPAGAPAIYGGNDMGDRFSHVMAIAGTGTSFRSLGEGGSGNGDSAAMFCGYQGEYIDSENAGHFTPMAGSKANGFMYTHAGMAFKWDPIANKYKFFIDYGLPVEGQDFDEVVVPLNHPSLGTSATPSPDTFCT